MRVYRGKWYNSVFITSSLTIREGISPTPAARVCAGLFPHYTWGYIDLNPRKLFLLPVPSLYVRVYRKRDEWPKGGHPFPHYTWGYIVQAVVPFGKIPVPSLYVRVYRREQRRDMRQVSSLTIREGISHWKRGSSFVRWFLHYTWGYIVIFAAECLFQFVPSLYVRVYRKEMQKKTQKLRSLLICEGILVIFASSRIPHIKNVKIFQKIHTKKGNQKYE